MGAEATNETLAQMPNLGPKSAKMLASAGITSPTQLRELGPVIAFLAVRQAGEQPSMNLLWAITAGIQDRHWTRLSPEEKQDLRDELDRLTR